MSARGRAEAVVVLVYVLALPFVLLVALLAWGVVTIVIWSPTLPYGLVLLLDLLPVFLIGVLFFILLRLTNDEYLAGLPLGRSPLRLLPLLLAASVSTGIAMWSIVVRGDPGPSGSILLSAVAFWGGIVGEWIAHRQLTRGCDRGTLLRWSLLCAAAVVGILVIAVCTLRSPQDPVEVASRQCERSYPDVRMAANRAIADIWTPTVGRHLGTRWCAELLSDDTPQ